MATVKMKVFSALCEMETFQINGKTAGKYDFGTQGDESPQTAEDYACGDMQFTPTAPTKEVLEKYGIDELEYWTIANQLSEMLSFGSCGWCV